MKSERELFEKAIVEKCGFNSKTSFELSGVTGDYKSDVTYFAWIMWQASANRQGYKLVPVNYECNWCGCTELDGFKDKAMIGAVDNDH
jgi:hypothetical protein